MSIDRAAASRASTDTTGGTGPTLVLGGTGKTGRRVGAAVQDRVRTWFQRVQCRT